MLNVLLLPNVWFHGSHSQSTGGRSSRNGQICAQLCWFEHIMRWVLMTHFGMPVEPDVKRIFATVSGPTRANAASTRCVGCTASNSAIGVEERPTAASAGANFSG